jgi:hypothetical protein
MVMVFIVQCYPPVQIGPPYRQVYLQITELLGFMIGKSDQFLGFSDADGFNLAY